MSNPIHHLLAGILAGATVLPCIAADEPSPGQVPPHPVRMERRIPAFPGAWGGGMFTSGGRGGRAIAVTNLEDSGPGSLRAAIETEGPRTVVFRVAGIIPLKSNLDIKNPDITIAGQSAPGDGICITNHSLNINTRNVVLRHLRVRRGDPIGGQGADNIGGNPERDIMVDHCSVSWGRDEGISLYRYMKPTPGGGQIKHAVRNLTTHDLNSSDPADGAADSDGDGYTNLEEFLNRTSPREAVDYLNLGNNVDSAS